MGLLWPPTYYYVTASAPVENVTRIWEKENVLSIKLKVHNLEGDDSALGGTLPHLKDRIDLDDSDSITPRIPAAVDREFDSACFRVPSPNPTNSLSSEFPSPMDSNSIANYNHADNSGDISTHSDAHFSSGNKGFSEPAGFITVGTDEQTQGVIEIKGDECDKQNERSKANMGLGGGASTISKTNVVALLPRRENDDSNSRPSSFTTTTTNNMAIAPTHNNGQTPSMNSESPCLAPLLWSWPHEHADRKREREADDALYGRHRTSLYIYGNNSMPFDVDRKLLKDVVREKMGGDVGRIEFMSAGTFHKAYLITLSSRRPLVARVARRFMPRVKTSSEVATIAYLRERTSVPVPEVFYWDANPYNRLGGEFILMNKAPGIPLARVYHSLSYTELHGLLKNLAALIIPLFAHRFGAIGSLYLGPDTSRSKLRSQSQAIEISTATPGPSHTSSSAYSVSHLLSNVPHFTPNGGLTPKPSIQKLSQDFHVGPIISWPFFGSNRGELVHPTELNRGPWSTTSSYLSSCADREIRSVISENEGRSAPHKLHLDPDEIRSSRYHRLRKVEGDESDESDEWGLEESEEDEWEGPGDLRYSYGDYRRMQRSAFLVSVLREREDNVRKEMGRWVRVMERIRGLVEKGKEEEFALDCHDLSLENVFVDQKDHTKITCIIDWESTTTRPLWAAAHLPAFIQSSPFVAKLFRKVVSEIPSDPTLAHSINLPPAYVMKHAPSPLAALCEEWLYYESKGVRLRMVHRCAEWDGWEEGLVESFLGSEDEEDVWFRGLEDEEGPDEAADECDDVLPEAGTENVPEHSTAASPSAAVRRHIKLSHPPVPVPLPPRTRRQISFAAPGAAASLALPVPSSLLDSTERAKEKMLDVTGDICGGRGGELGRRLEAWLTITGGGDQE